MTLTKFLHYLLPPLCLWNLYLAWGNTDLACAWAVAFAGWAHIVISEIKNGN